MLMRLPRRKALVIMMAAAAMFCLAGASAVCGADAGSSCTLLAKAEIQSAVGQNVGDGKLNARANPAVGQPCEYKVGDYGAFSILNKTAGPGETADRTMAELKKSKIAVSDAPGIGDRSFYSSPGYGMVQLNTFKGSRYLIITLLVPGAAEAAQKNAAAQLMRKALARL